MDEVFAVFTELIGLGRLERVEEGRGWRISRK
jgi:hypothetical protein